MAGGEAGGQRGAGGTGAVPGEAPAALRAHAGFDIQRIHEIEREVKRDATAFTTAVAERMAAAGQAAAGNRDGHIFDQPTWSS